MVHAVLKCLHSATFGMIVVSAPVHTLGQNVAPV
jgi:hypothetical protein